MGTFRDWLEQNNIGLSVGVIDFSSATADEISFIPLAFYKYWATKRQFRQIWAVLRDLGNLEGSLRTIKELASFIEPEHIPNTIRRADGAIPWRRGDLVFDFEEDEASEDDALQLGNMDLDAGKPEDDDSTLLFSDDFSP